MVVTIRTRSALVLLLLAPACARPNPVFQGEAGAGTVGDAGSAEGSAGSGGTSAGEGSASGDTGAATTGGHGSSSGSSTGWYGSSSTGEPIECELETKNECSVYITPNGDPIPCENEDESCVPWALLPGGEIITTYCFEFGGRGLGEECLPGCVDDPELKCASDFVCDAPPGAVFGKCRVPCTGSYGSPNCAEGLCYEFNPTGWQYGICRGNCNPTGGELCPGKEVCAVDTSVPAPWCVLDDAPRELGQSCEEHVCGDGLICVDASLLEGCDAERCCALLCDPPTDVTCAPGTCMQVPEDHGIVDIGYCVP